jgi:uncharacterized membrane protein (DUF106 family)
MGILELDSSSVTAIATVVLALVTIIYASITNSILIDQKKTRKIQQGNCLQRFYEVYVSL